MSERTMTEMDLQSIGWSPFFQAQYQERLQAAADHGDEATLRPYRVVIEYQDRYRLLGEDGLAWAQMTGNLLREAKDDRLRRPAVGDWVLVRDGERAMGTIVDLFARRTRFIRQAAGRRIGPQVVAANIDAVFVVTSCNQEFSLRRLERYLTTIESSGARPLLILNKSDLCDAPNAYQTQIAEIAPDVPVVTMSALAEDDIGAMRNLIVAGETVAFVGSSGVGKSTLINGLIGRHLQQVGDIRERDGRGRHTTTHRELIVMADGGVLIDTPGMRELKPWQAGSGLLEAFPEIARLAAQCRFRDCSHGQEPGCGVSGAIEAGTLPAARLKSYTKLFREQQVADARRTPGATAGQATTGRQRKPKQRR